MLVGSLESNHHRNAKFDTLTSSAILRPQVRRRHDGHGENLASLHGIHNSGEQILGEPERKPGTQRFAMFCDFPADSAESSAKTPQLLGNREDIGQRRVVTEE